MPQKNTSTHPDLRLLDTLPFLLSEIPDPPKQLYIQGQLPPADTKLVCVVGSRVFSRYGQVACEKLIAGLAPYNISIVSGLALGIDSIAHKAALKHNVHTMAVPGSGLDRHALYPHSHKRLADEIVRSGGALLSEFEPDTRGARWTFPRRNRIMAGMSHVTVIIEAQDKSGTLITARLATEYNRDVCAVPGSIFSKNSVGAHKLLKDGAIPLTSPNDLIDLLSLERRDASTPTSAHVSTNEKEVLHALAEGPLSRETLVEQTPFSMSEINTTLSLLELKGLVTERDGMLSTELPSETS